ncbi:hypothetical protein I6A84_36335 [Frankia sp. CNm7]|uniref:Uncharacterized protein n=1 Tax=Frankia nepalensis TaxID=1836974 RepID=A0A937ULY3_9ACTN|nr:hypothetical protein [Frankia nepalensis]MBL7494712.1 hypothetical protein [Frankia nepalensis]MBL7514133.1 hypothetical protein [Frankia nepalensis]MBL7523381.1 hypothetical protein [Frankia nepalensis]MBL7626503.1 hypothetical protein [Frankia nepalensis]
MSSSGFDSGATFEAPGIHNSSDTLVNQAVFRYVAGPGFSLVASSLTEYEESTFAQSMTRVIDLEYQPRDTSPSLCFTRTRRGYGVVIYRVPDPTRQRTSGAAHVLVGRSLTPAVALALSQGLDDGEPVYRGWLALNPPDQQLPRALRPMDPDRIAALASGRLGQLSELARSARSAGELVGLVDGLLRAGGTRQVSVYPNAARPEALLCAALEIFEPIGIDWTFSTFEHRERSDFKVAFFPQRLAEPNGVPVDLSRPRAKFEGSQVLVDTYVHHGPRAVADLLGAAGVTDWEGLLEWVANPRRVPREFGAVELLEAVACPGSAGQLKKMPEDGPHRPEDSHELRRQLAMEARGLRWDRLPGYAEIGNATRRVASAAFPDLSLSEDAEAQAQVLWREILTALPPGGDERQKSLAKALLDRAAQLGWVRPHPVAEIDERRLLALPGSAVSSDGRLVYVTVTRPRPVAPPVAARPPASGGPDQQRPFTVAPPQVPEPYLPRVEPPRVEPERPAEPAISGLRASGDLQVLLALVGVLGLLVLLAVLAESVL